MSWNVYNSIVSSESQKSRRIPGKGQEKIEVDYRKKAQFKHKQGDSSKIK